MHQGRQRTSTGRRSCAPPGQTPSESSGSCRRTSATLPGIRWPRLTQSGLTSSRLIRSLIYCCFDSPETSRRHDCSCPVSLESYLPCRTLLIITESRNPCPGARLLRAQASGHLCLPGLPAESLQAVWMGTDLPLEGAQLDVLIRPEDEARVPGQRVPNTLQVTK